MHDIGDSVYVPLRSAQNRGPPDLVRPEQLRCPEFYSLILDCNKKEHYFHSVLFVTMRHRGFEPRTT